MKLYEINAQIEDLTNRILIDPETGEIAEDTDAVIEEIDALQMERKDVLEYLAKTVLNLRAEQTAIKAEEERLKSRRDSAKKREESIMKVLDRECGGTKTDLGVATISYRSGKTLEIRDADTALDWLASKGYGNYIRYPEPEIDKAGVKNLINMGTAVPGCVVNTTSNCSLK